MPWHFAEDASAAKCDLVLYAADTPNSWKVATVLEELGATFAVVHVSIADNEQTHPDYVRMNPNARTVTLLDKSVEPPFSVFESGAIMLYVCEKHADTGTSGERPRLIPTDPTGRSEVMQWLMWQQSGLGPMVGQCMYFKRIAYPVATDPSRLDLAVERFEKEAVRLMKVLDARLDGRDYICGPGRGTYGLADVACYGYASQHWWTGISHATDRMPNLRRWLKSVGRRPAAIAGCSCPGRPVFKGAPTFKEMAEDATIREALERSAREDGREANGRLFFGWKDFQKLYGGDGAAVPFRAHAPGKTVGAEGGGRLKNPTFSS